MHAPAKSPLAHVPNPDKRLQELSWQLNTIEDPTHRQEYLIACFADQYPPVRQMAARALSQEPPNAASIAALMSILDDTTPTQPAPFIPTPSPQVKLAALAALRNVPHRPLGPLYTRLSQDGDADIRYQSLVNLFDLHEDLLPEHIEQVLERGLSDSDAEVAVIASQFASERGYCGLIDAIDKRRREAVQGGQLRLQFALAEGRLLSLRDEAASQAIVDELQEEFVRGLQNEVASSASGSALVDLALGQGRREMAALPLRKVLNRWFLHPLLKVEAAAQLTRLGDAQGLSYLSDIMDGRRKDARGHAISVAGKLHIEPLYGQVARIAQSGEDYHNDTAILALGNYDTPTARAQLESLSTSHSDEELRELSLSVLQAPAGTPITFFSLEQQANQDI